MRKHYETTPKETLIDILVASREEVEKLQNRNKERKQEIERLNKGLDELEELCKTKYYEKNTTDIDSIAIAGNLYVYMYKKIKELKGSDKEWEV